MKTRPLPMTHQNENRALSELFSERGLFLFLFALIFVVIPPAEAVPERIVSLAPGLTECLFALGAGNSVVGVTDYDRYPPEVRDLPSVGGYYDPSVERILALSPDLVLGIPSFHGPLLERLRKMGISTGAFSLHRELGEVRDTLKGLGDLLNLRSQAASTWGEIEKGLALEREKLLQICEGQPPSVLVIVWTDPLTVAGGVNYLNDILDSLSIPNAAGGITYTFPQVDKEKVLAMDPDVVIVARASEGMVILAGDFLAVFEGLPLRAALENNVYELPADVLFHPGPRVLEAARLLSELVTRERRGEGIAAKEQE